MMIFSTAKKTPALTALAGALLAVSYMSIPAQAQSETCTTEIQTIDRTLQSTQLDAELQAKVSALRESAITRNSQGDADGCMKDVANIKSLLGL